MRHDDAMLMNQCIVTGLEWFVYDYIMSVYSKQNLMMGKKIFIINSKPLEHYDLLLLLIDCKPKGI